MNTFSSFKVNEIVDYPGSDVEEFLPTDDDWPCKHL